MPQLFALACLLLMLLWQVHVYAQLLLYPYTPPPTTKTKRPAARQLLSPPFWDDFSNHEQSNQADESHWIAPHVLVNNHMANNPPTQGVATLDALRADGTPYNFAQATARGFSDTLLSQPIDLSGFHAGSGLYLSFFWQGGGKGEVPDPEDFLSLQFRRQDGSWQEVWRQYGETIDPNRFTQQILAINQDHYLHEAFQFQFVRYGRLSGTFDHWHIDYVYLNANRSSSDLSYRDIASTNTPTRYFAQYSAIPYYHYAADTAAFALAQRVGTRLNNLDNNFRALTYTASLFDEAQNPVLVYDANQNLTTELTIEAFAPSAPLIFPGDDFQLRAIPSRFLLPDAPTTIHYCFQVNTSDDDTTIPPYDLRINDNICGRIVLQDYYAYDDGSFEYVAGVNQRFGKMAVAFTLPNNIAARLTAVDIAFVPYRTDLSNQSFVLWVWRSLSPEREVFRRGYPIVYAPNTQTVVRYPIDTFQQLWLQGTFYVGVQQVTDDFLAVGFDMNLDSSDKIFAYVNGEWSPNTQVPGSLLIRPVFADPLDTHPPITALPEEQHNLFRLYPNPTSHVINLEGPTEQLNQVLLYTVSGKLIRALRPQPYYSLQELPAGFYLLQLHYHNGNRQVLKFSKY